MYYKITKEDGELLGVTKQIFYVCKIENGFFVLCNQELAEGITFKGVIYNSHILPGFSEGYDFVSITSISKEEYEMLSE